MSLIGWQYRQGGERGQERKECSGYQAEIKVDGIDECCRNRRSRISVVGRKGVHKN